MSELQAIAKEQGIDIDTLSHKNRKSVLAKAIEAKQQGKSIRELGLLKPQKTVLKRAKSETKIKSEFKESRYNYHPDVKNILIKGQNFTSKYKLDEKIPLSKKEIEISAKIDKIIERRKQGKGDTIKDLETAMLLQKELAREKDKASFEVIQKHRAVLADVIAHNKVPLLKAKALARQVELDRNLTDTQKQQINKLLIEFHQLTNGMGAKTIKKIEANSDRAHTSASGLVDIGKVVKKADIFHEFAHHIEISDPKKAKLAAQWRDSKSDRSGLHKMKDLTGDKGYRDDEVAVKDKYFDPYVGKVYPNGYTEVISMGIEHFSSPDKMKKLYDKDPDHYHFILGLLMK